METCFVRISVVRSLSYFIYSCYLCWLRS